MSAPSTTVYEGDDVQQKLSAAQELMEKTCNSKQPSDPMYQPQWEMAGAHGMFFRCLRHIYTLAPTIAPKDYLDFVNYCLYWVEGIEHHHHWEETAYMDEFKGAVSVPQIKDEHSKFTQTIHDIQLYLVSCIPKGSKWGPHNNVVKEEKSQDFSAERFRDLVRVLVIDGTFVQHLSDEITYLDPARLRGHGLTHDDLVTANKNAEAYLKANTVPAFFVWGLRTTAKGDFPPAPWLVKNVLMKYVFYWPLRKVMRFSPTGPA